MAFLSKLGNILRQTSAKHINVELSSSRPSLYQAIRWMSSSKLFVGGISYSTDDTSLREAFSKYGEVIEARVILDRETGRSRGFGFVTYTSSEEASSAIQGFDGQELHGRVIRVNYAADRSRGSFGGGGGFGGGGYGGGSGGYGGGGGYGNYGGGGYGNYGGGAGGSFGGVSSNAGGNYGSGGNFGNNSSDNFSGGVNTGGFDDTAGNVGVAGGGGGSDNFGGNGLGSGYDGSSGFGRGGIDQFGADGSSSAGEATGGYNQIDSSGSSYNDEEPLEGNYRDDGDPDDFAKRA